MSEQYFPMERNVNQTLWYAIMQSPYDGEQTFENDTFLVRPYDWNCDDEEGTNEYHFWHKPSNLKVYWYKYPLRAVMCNKEITNPQFYAVLKDCMNSVQQGRVKIIDSTFEKWWE